MQPVRGKLHLNNGRAFAAYLSERGWVEEPIHAEYQILRMRHPEEREPLILYARMRSEHATLPDNQHMFNHLVYEYIADKRLRFERMLSASSGVAVRASMLQARSSDD